MAAAILTQKTLLGVNSQTIFRAALWGGHYFLRSDCMADKNKRIDIRVSESQLAQINKLAAKAKQSRSEYLINAALNKNITVFDGGKEIAHQLFKIGTNINQLKILSHQGKINLVYMDKFAGEVNAVWQSLNLLTNQTEPTQE